jgi:hypothetical protein
VDTCIPRTVESGWRKTIRIHRIRKPSYEWARSRQSFDSFGAQADHIAWIQNHHMIFEVRAGFLNVLAEALPGNRKNHVVQPGGIPTVFEPVGAFGRLGPDYLVMEYVEGSARAPAGLRNCMSVIRSNLHSDCVYYWGCQVYTSSADLFSYLS